MFNKLDESLEVPSVTQCKGVTELLDGLCTTTDILKVSRETSSLLLA